MKFEHLHTSKEQPPAIKSAPDRPDKLLHVRRCMDVYVYLKPDRGVEGGKSTRRR